MNMHIVGSQDAICQDLSVTEMHTKAQAQQIANQP